MPATITREPADSPDSQLLIQELDDHLGALYPAVSRHGYSVDKLLRQGVHFFVLRLDSAPIGCGGVQLYPDFAELKRMYTRPAHRGQGHGRAMLEHLAAHVRAANIRTLRLETGIHQREAIAMYTSFGFSPIGPFGPYTSDPLSAYFEMTL